MHENLAVGDGGPVGSWTHTPAAARMQVRVKELVKVETTFVEEGGCNSLLETLKADLHNSTITTLVDLIQRELEEREKLRDMHSEVLASLTGFSTELTNLPTLLIFFDAFFDDCFNIYPAYGAYVPVVLRHLSEKMAGSPELDRLFQVGFDMLLFPGVLSRL